MYDVFVEGSNVHAATYGGLSIPTPSQVAGPHAVGLVPPGACVIVRLVHAPHLARADRQRVHRSERDRHRGARTPRRVPFDSSSARVR